MPSTKKAIAWAYRLLKSCGIAPVQCRQGLGSHGAVLRSSCLAAAVGCSSTYWRRTAFSVILAVEDDIEARRDALIDALGKRLHRASHTRHLFTIRWQMA